MADVTRDLGRAAIAAALETAAYARRCGMLHSARSALARARRLRVEITEDWPHVDRSVWAVNEWRQRWRAERRHME